MNILLDTNFIMSCVKDKVDFLETEEYGQLLLAKEVSNELKNISQGKKDKDYAKIALNIIEKNKSKFKMISLYNNIVDEGIVDYVNKNEGIAVATFDSELRTKLKGKARIIVLRAKKRIEIV